MNLRHLPRRPTPGSTFTCTCCDRTTIDGIVDLDADPYPNGRPIYCPPCIERLRRAELDAWLGDLQARGLARVIPVRDLDVELEASHAGRLALSYTESDGTPARYLFVSAADAADALGVSP